MAQDTFRSMASLSRRSALSGAGLAAAALGLGTVSRVAAQEATPVDYGDHPIVGSWMVSTPGGPAMAVFFADGTNIQGLPVTQTSPLGVTFVSTQVGRWEPTRVRGPFISPVSSCIPMPTVRSSARSLLTPTRRSMRTARPCTTITRSRDRRFAMRPEPSSPCSRVGPQPPESAWA